MICFGSWECGDDNFMPVKVLRASCSTRVPNMTKVEVAYTMGAGFLDYYDAGWPDILYVTGHPYQRDRR
jgi:hypothetical protein